MKAPAIPVVFVGPDANIELICILDSVADVSTISKETADVLGIDTSGKVEDSYGVGGRVKSTKSRVQIVIGHGSEVYRDTIPVLVVLDQYEFSPLLGRKGFFDLYEIKIMEKKERIELSRLQRTPKPKPYVK